LVFAFPYFDIDAAHVAMALALAYESLHTTCIVPAGFYNRHGYFGKSAIKSLRAGVPNMNVLIALGAAAAFTYSLIGTF